MILNSLQKSKIDILLEIGMGEYTSSRIRYVELYT